MSDKDKSEPELAAETEAAKPALEPAADGNGEPAEPDSAQSATQALGL